jgi:hypothetical protein
MRMKISNRKTISRPQTFSVVPVSIPASILSLFMSLSFILYHVPPLFFFTNGLCFIGSHQSQMLYPSTSLKLSSMLSSLHGFSPCFVLTIAKHLDSCPSLGCSGRYTRCTSGRPPGPGAGGGLGSWIASWYTLTVCESESTVERFRYIICVVEMAIPQEKSPNRHDLRIDISAGGR